MNNSKRYPPDAGTHGAVRMYLTDDEITILKEKFPTFLSRGEVTLDGNELWVEEGQVRKWKIRLGI